jgi:hypothetical protein
MNTVEQYRAEARVYEILLMTACSPSEIAEYRGLQQGFTSRADDLVERRKREGEHAERENILRCLGAAVILNWNTIPTKLQRALFEAASTIEGTETAPLRDVLAQFLHDHKNDAQRAGDRQTAALRTPAQ